MPINKPEFIGPGGGNPFRNLRVRLPRRFGRIGILVLVLILAAIVLLNFFFTYVRPNELGIKEVRIGVDRGIHEKVYGPGLAFQIPFGFEVIHRFPHSVQVFELTDTRPSNLELASHEFEETAKIQTSDGFYVDVDVTILYRIVDPYKLITTIGPGRQYLEQGVKPKAVPVLKQALGELTTENFYNSPMRVDKAEKAREMLDAELQRNGMQVDQVLIRYFRYSDEIQRNIEEKKLQDQLVFKNQSQARAAVEAANLKRITEEGEMHVKVTLEEGEAYRVTKGAEKDLYVRTRKAEADLAVKLAEARRTELVNDAMQQAGADKAVAMEMAEVLQGLDTIVVPVGGTGGFNPLDLAQTIRLFGVAVPGQANPETPAAVQDRPANTPTAPASAQATDTEELAP